MIVNWITDQKYVHIAIKKIIGTIDKVRVRSIDYSIVININTWVLSQNCIYVREHPCSQEIHVKIFRENRMSRYSMGIK